mmetsp:Transcript_80640/g.233176  ORF Transcript_80640/g.233176 Transcript_80640/m.233176 type:complete len:217 (-) Transcript_80640:1058-1708(-)
MGSSSSGTTTRRTRRSSGPHARSARTLRPAWPPAPSPRRRAPPWSAGATGTCTSSQAIPAYVAPRWPASTRPWAASRCWWKTRCTTTWWQRPRERSCWEKWPRRPRRSRARSGNLGRGRRPWSGSRCPGCPRPTRISSCRRELARGGPASSSTNAGTCCCCFPRAIAWCLSRWGSCGGASGAYSGSSRLATAASAGPWRTTRPYRAFARAATPAAS